MMGYWQKHEGRWGRPYNLHMPARISLHALLNFLREVSKKTILVVANRSCKRQIRLPSDLSGSHLLPSEHTDVDYTTDPLPVSQQALGGIFRPHEKGCLGVSSQVPNINRVAAKILARNPETARE